MEFGTCTIRDERLSLMDKAAVLYQEKLVEGAVAQPSLQPTSCPLSAYEAVPRGWALKTTKKATRFSPKQRQFLDELFEEGQESGRKLDAATAAQRMRRAKDLTGNRRFHMEEFLSPNQIQAYFSRKAAQLRPVQCTEDDHVDEDMRAAEEQKQYSDTRSLILEECQLTHPIEYDSINLCNLYSTGKITSLTVAILKEICLHLDIDIAGVEKSRKKAPFIERIELVTSTCSGCSK